MPPVPEATALDQVFLLTEAFCCTEAPTLITTTLGSCVAVCLWDCVRRSGGMNHFVLPRTPPEACERSLRYGDVAIDALVRAMAELGSRHKHLRASVFGGANVLPAGGEGLRIGSLNVRFALDHLSSVRIPVMNRDTGGSRGMSVRFRTDTGAAEARRLDRARIEGAAA